ncbi:nad dependent epimerase dehydratase family protein [Colletotrichum karsti]|uniref:Nad dependent epimerase dehydratase family protein n=1 Tax=Colletotrichum karsti TaxID=1095194 RepID=A0A9P6I8S3_9PEZI|nr:nad dependent epimerase dehydratase family protein [Colletotrichum karsti]KAF9878448.1 nad dependent epimerase dehydratase family protein [Colletotrichum karsti]
MFSQNTEQTMALLAQAALAPLLLHLLVYLLSGSFVTRLAKQYRSSIEKLLFSDKALEPFPTPIPQDKPKPRILLTGATGYVGGSVLHALLSHPSLTTTITPSNPITLPLRGAPDRLAKLTATYGPRVHPVPITSLDDIPTITRLASAHDVVVNAGSGFHPPSAEALVRGLALRKARTKTPVWMLHTSGCSNIADKPVTGTPRPDVEYEDANAEAVFAFEEEENKRDWYPQRAAELAVLRTAEELGVQAASIQAPCIFGTGTGLFQTAGLMIPIMMGFVLGRGYGFTVGDGSGVMDRVHVADLADLYVLCVLDVLQRDGANVPTGRAGIVFPTAGRTLTADIARKCLDVAFATRNLPKPGGPRGKEVRTLTIEEAAVTTAGNASVAETGWGGHRKTKGTVARERLGWRPTRLDEAWERDFETELRAALSGRRGATIAACIADTK